MVATTLTWVHDLNYVVAGGTLLAQYQDILYRTKQFLTGAIGGSPGSWSVLSSSDGGTASAADHWTSTASITPNSAGLARSWIVLQSPTTYLPSPSNFTYWLIECLDPSPGTPDAMSLYVASSAFTGGTTTARPTSTTESAAMSLTFLTRGFVPRHTHGWRTTRGDWVMVYTDDGQQAPTTGIVSARLNNGESALPWPVMNYAASNTGAPGGALAADSSFLFNTSSTWHTFAIGGGAQNSAVVSSPAAFMTSWTNGSSNANNILMDMPGDGVNNSATAAAYVGRFVDIRFCARNTASGTSQAPEDPDSIVRKCVGGLWLPTPTGTVISF